MKDGPTALITTIGGMGGNAIEQLMREALEASALDTVAAALESGRFDLALILADAPLRFAVPEGALVELDPEAEAFHLGRALARAIERHRIARMAFVGAGSGPLLSSADFEALVDGLNVDGPACVTNNFYSSDFFALAPAALFARLDPLPGSDNPVPRRLKDALALEVRELPRSMETQLNIDSPIDLVALSLSERAGSRLRAVLQSWNPGTERVAEAARFLTDRDAEVFVAGRVGARTWRYLERETASRIRMLAEERGMAAAGRDTGGSARSLLGQIVQSVGAERWFRELLPELGQAAFIDTRPLLVHLGISAGRGDRFAADLSRVDLIEDEALRELVCASLESGHPTVLGGHTLVAGDLMLLNDWAWEERERDPTGRHGGA